MRPRHPVRSSTNLGRRLRGPSATFPHRPLRPKQRRGEPWIWKIKKEVLSGRGVGAVGSVVKEDKFLLSHLLVHRSCHAAATLLDFILPYA